MGGEKTMKIFIPIEKRGLITYWLKQFKTEGQDLRDFTYPRLIGFIWGLEALGVRIFIEDLHVDASEIANFILDKWDGTIEFINVGEIE